MKLRLDRRTFLRGVLAGAGVGVALPLLDIFLNDNATALASGAPMPVRFGTWFWGLGVNPQRWYPDTPGANYVLKEESMVFAPHKAKISILGNFAIPLDGKPNIPHISGGAAIRTGIAMTRDNGLPGTSLDVLISDHIGGRTRFRSLDLSALGDPRNSLSGRGGGNLNPAEISAAAFYQRLFGAGFQDPNSAAFNPDPVVMARRSVLSAVAEQRRALESRLGANDKRQLDQYFTSLRQVETQLELQLKRPQPMAACHTPGPPKDDHPGGADAVAAQFAEIETVTARHKLMSDLLAMALACDQTRVFNLHFNNPVSELTRLGSTTTHHQTTHEESLDSRLGYQPQATWFIEQCMAGWAYFVNALEQIREGDGTLLDNMIVFAHSEGEFAKFHTLDNTPMMIAGSGGGRIRTGLYIDGNLTPVTRVGLALQQLMGVQAEKWGTGSLETSKPVQELFA